MDSQYLMQLVASQRLPLDVMLAFPINWMNFASMLWDALDSNAATAFAKGKKKASRSPQPSVKQEQCDVTGEATGASRSRKSVSDATTSQSSRKRKRASPASGDLPKLPSSRRKKSSPSHKTPASTTRHGVVRQTMKDRSFSETELKLTAATASATPEQQKGSCTYSPSPSVAATRSSSAPVLTSQPTLTLLERRRLARQHAEKVSSNTSSRSPQLPTLATWPIPTALYTSSSRSVRRDNAPPPTSRFSTLVSSSAPYNLKLEALPVPNWGGAPLSEIVRYLPNP